MIYTMRPFDGGRWTDPETPAGKRRGTQAFRASWSDTLAKLGDEIEKLGGTNVIIQIDAREGDVRRDGMLRADAKVGHRGVVVSFDSRHGPLRYACDTYAEEFYGTQPGWKANLRAIALTLDALRAVERYGAASAHQQYTGWQQLPPGRGDAPSSMTREQALIIVQDQAGFESNDLAFVIKRARINSHPDHNDGDRTAWDNVEQAARVLGLAS